jgi:hypothetical protein
MENKLADVGASGWLAGCCLRTSCRQASARVLEANCSLVRYKRSWSDLLFSNQTACCTMAVEDAGRVVEEDGRGGDVR